MRKQWLFLISCFLLIFYIAGDIFAEENPPVVLQTQAIRVKQPGKIPLGNISITALKPAAITAANNLLLKIPENFPAAWDTKVSVFSLSGDSYSGLINEAINYIDKKTLKINVTQDWPKDAKITVTNLKLDILDFPTYEQLFGGQVTNCAGLILKSGSTLTEASEQVLLKISGLYSGDDGWDSAESGSFPKSLAKFSITDISPDYPTQLLVDRGFSAVVRAKDGYNNFIASATDSVVLSSHLSTNPGTASDVKFYTDGTYNTELSPAVKALTSGKATIYAKDAAIESAVLKATHQTQSIITGESATVTLTPYRYSVTSNFPQPTVNMQWEEEVQAKDAAGQDITTSPPSQVTLSSDGNVKFYPDSNYQESQSATSLDYPLSGGNCTIYMRGPVSESVHIKVNDPYDSLSNDGGLTSRAFTVVPASIDIHFDFSYDETGGSEGVDKLTIRAWIVKAGSIVTTGLGSASLNIYNFDQVVGSPITGSILYGDGIYWFSNENTGLPGGQGYFALATITYQGLSYKGGGNFYVTMDKQVLSEIGDIATQVDKLKNQTSALSGEIVSSITPTLSSIEGKTDLAVTATGTTLPAQIDATREELQPHIVSRILNTETEVIQGGTLDIRYRTYPNTSPLLDVYDPNNNLVLTNQEMTEVTSDGVYEYSLDFSNSWGRGFFTVICSESTYGTLDGVTISVISTSLARVGSDVTAVLGSTAGIDDLSETQNMLDVIFADKLAKLNTSLVEALEYTVSSVANELGREQTRDIYMMMSDISNNLKTEGVDVKGEIEQLYHVSEESVGDINYLRNKFVQMENLLEINRRMIDSVTYEPIVRQWYEFR